MKVTMCATNMKSNRIKDSDRSRVSHGILKVMLTMFQIIVMINL